VEGRATSFPPAFAALLTPRAYAHPAEAVELVETPISWVLLAGGYAYKIKRPVRYPFVDMRTLARRQLLCQEELRLNRRLAPTLYLAVVAVCFEDGQARMDGVGVPIEYAVRMRRFDREQELDRLLAAARVETPELAAFGQRLAQFHATAPIADAAQRWGAAAAVRTLVLDNWRQSVEAAGAVGTGRRIEEMRVPLTSKLDRVAEWVTRRKGAGRVRECHGDLHTRNIARFGGELTAFDCVEFEPSFRWIDVADEAALLLMDLESRGHGTHAHAFWDGYLLQSGDYQAHRVLDLYKAHRALVRAKVCALSLTGERRSVTAEALRIEHTRFLDRATQALGPAEVRLVLMCGPSGSGKSWLARQLAPSLGLVHIRSDVERKRLADLPALANSGSPVGEGLYSPAMDRKVYARLEQCAAETLGGGYGVIVDATFGRRTDRAHFGALAERLGVALQIVECRAEPAMLLQRIAERGRRADDPSEADAAVLQCQLQRWEAPGDEECAQLIATETAAAGAVEDATVRLLRMPAQPL
jgi:aminoglycoside phosphotransferase family enzyme/predicted kinase